MTQASTLKKPKQNTSSPVSAVVLGLSGRRGETKIAPSFDFVSTSGATLTIPTEHAAEILNAKTEQLGFLTRLLSDALQGDPIDLTAKQKDIAAMLAADVAYEVNRLAGIVGDLVDLKGGA